MKIQIVKFENGKFGARIKYFFNRYEYLSISNGCTFTKSSNIRDHCMFDNEDNARKIANEYIERYKINKKKLIVEVIDEIKF